MINIKELKNGIRVVTEKIDYVESVSFGVWVKQGAVDELPEVSGISHFIEHMMFKGTEKRDAKTIAEDIDRIGGQINAFTGKEATCYYVKMVKNNLEKGAEVVIDMLNNSVFDQKELSRERKVIFEEMKMTEDTPDELAHDEIMEVVFKGNSLGNSIIGKRKTLNSINHDIILNYKKENYSKDSVVISVAGNFDEDKFIEFLENKFDRLNDRKEKKTYLTEPYKTGFKTIKKDIQQSHICLAARGVRLDDERYYQLNILNNVMGSSMSSRFFQNIREKKGLAYSVYSMTSSFSFDGYFNIYMGVANDKIGKALDGIKQELDLLERKGISQDELNMSKEQLKASYTFSQENVASRMFSNGKSTILLGKTRTGEEVLSEIDKVSMDDIEKIKELICNTDLYSGVLVTGSDVNIKKLW